MTQYTIPNTQYPKHTIHDQPVILTTQYIMHNANHTQLNIRNTLSNIQ